MGVFDLFSKRQRRERGEVPDVYTYDNLPNKLRVQIVHIVRDAIGRDNYGDKAAEAYDVVNRALCKETGVFQLVDRASSNMEAVFNFFLAEKSTERALDVVEILCKYINIIIAGDPNYRYNVETRLAADEAIEEINQRFKEHGVGYQYEGDIIVRLDSDFLHSETVKPALTMLRLDGFSGANEEFLESHQHYRHGRNKECLVYSLKAFESTMRAICKLRGWEVSVGATASGLIKICFDKELLPKFLESEMTALRSILESGIPTLRNRLGGHGQGVEPIVVPDYVARFALNLTATNIIFLTEAHSAKK